MSASPGADFYICILKVKCDGLYDTKGKKWNSSWIIWNTVYSQGNLINIENDGQNNII